MKYEAIQIFGIRAAAVSLLAPILANDLAAFVHQKVHIAIIKRGAKGGLTGISGPPFAANYFDILLNIARDMLNVTKRKKIRHPIFDHTLPEESLFWSTFLGHSGKEKSFKKLS